MEIGDRAWITKEENPFLFSVLEVKVINKSKKGLSLTVEDYLGRKYKIKGSKHWRDKTQIEYYALEKSKDERIHEAENWVIGSNFSRDKEIDKLMNHISGLTGSGYVYVVGKLSVPEEKALRHMEELESSLRDDLPEFEFQICELS